jgi:DNA-binding transcriptional regulator YiaG
MPLSPTRLAPSDHPLWQAADADLRTVPEHMRDVRALRAALNLSQVAFACLLGISRAELQRLEHGVEKPTRLQLWALRGLAWSSAGDDSSA